MSTTRMSNGDAEVVFTVTVDLKRAISRKEEKRYQESVDAIVDLWATRMVDVIIEDTRERLRRLRDQDFTIKEEQR